MTIVADRSADAARFSEELVRRLDAAASGRGRLRVVGVEHEFAVLRGDDQIDFASMIHSLGVPGRRLHPTNRDVYLTATGSAIMADGPVAEVATPPIPAGPWFTVHLDESLRGTGRLLEGLLPPGDILEGGSTHISVEVDPASVDSVAARYARTYAAVAMLLMDRPHSPGLLVRPRPGRLELGGEYVTGRELRVAALFAAASGAVVERQARTAGEGLPPLLDVRLEPARRRYGWYVDRAAFGPDLYASGREAHLRLAGGGSVSAQDYLEYAWQLVRPTAESMASRQELKLVDRVVAGTDPLPLEAAEHDTGISRGGPGAAIHDIGRALAPRSRPGFTVRASYATWDWVAFAAGGDGSWSYLTVPAPQLGVFLDELEAGRLDDIIAGHRSASPGDRTLRFHSDTERASIRDRVEAGPALLPEDRYGIGAGPVSAVRPGKRMPASEPRFSRTRSGMAVPAAALLVIGALISLVGTVLGSRAGASAQESESPDPRVRVESVDAKVAPSGELWLRVAFAEPWRALPPRDVFSLFFSLTVEADGRGVFVGWQTHDGVEEPYSDLQMVILADGSIALATGIFEPAGDIEVVIDNGSWQDESTTSAVFSTVEVTIPASDVTGGDFAAFGPPVYDLVAAVPIVVPGTTVDLAAVLGAGTVVDAAGDGVVTDDTGDNLDYYGLFDADSPDVVSATWQQVELTAGVDPGSLLERLLEICAGSLGPGTTAVCPADPAALAAADGWMWIDLQFSGPMELLQAGMAWTDPGRSAFDGPEFDPNTGHNTSLDVFQTPDGYAVGGTTFDEEFAFGPSDDVMAVLRADGVSLILSADALADCTDPALFVVGPGGIDIIDLPEQPTSMVTVGVTTTTTSMPEATSTETTLPGSVAEPGSAPTTTTMASSAPTTQPEVGGGPGSNPLWPILIGLGLLLIAFGLSLWLRADGPPPVSIPVSFEKGNDGGSAVAVAR